jgi:hypothetical protein
MKKKTTQQTSTKSKENQLKHLYTKSPKDEIKMGYLSKSVADQIKQQPGEIRAEIKQLIHVVDRHYGDSLKKLGLTAGQFVRMIVKDFNRIYRGHSGRLLLVLWNGTPKAVVINLKKKDAYYIVVTAHIRSKKNFKDTDLLWEK